METIEAELREEIKKLNAELKEKSSLANRTRSELVLVNSQLEAIEQLLDGQEVSDFMLSFGIVWQVRDALQNQMFGISE